PSTAGYYWVQTAESGSTSQPQLSVTWTDVPDPTVNPSVPPLTETGLGVPPGTSFYGSGNESTNLVNGNLVVSVPVVPGKPGRGVTLSMSAVYNHQIWPNGAAQPASSDYPLGLGWRLHLGQIAFLGSGPNSGGFLYIVPTGEQHLLQPNVDGYYYSTDATYLRYSHARNTLWFKDGTQHRFNWITGSGQPDANIRSVTQIVDTNGNYISVLYEVDAGNSNSSRI